jgi:hypothetical protein
MITPGIAVSYYNLNHISAVTVSSSFDAVFIDKEHTCVIPDSHPKLASGKTRNGNTPGDSRCASCVMLRALGLILWCATRSFTGDCAIQETFNMTYDVGDTQDDAHVGRPIGDIPGMSTYQRISRDQLVAQLCTHSISVDHNCSTESMRDLSFKHVLTEGCIASEGMSCWEMAHIIHADNSDKQEATQVTVLKSILPHASKRYLTHVFDMLTAFRGRLHPHTQRTPPTSVILCKPVHMP